MDTREYKFLTRETRYRQALSRQRDIIAQAASLEYYDLCELYRTASIQPRDAPPHTLFAPGNINALTQALSAWLPAEGDPVFLLIVFLLLTADNPCTRAASAARPVNPLTLSIAKRELDLLECVARAGSRRIFAILSLVAGLPPLDFDGISQCDETVTRTLLPEFQRMLDLFASPAPWSSHIPELERWHRKWGYGTGLYHLSFEIEHNALDGLSFKPLANCAIPCTDDFFGYTDERETVRQNTLRFIQGLPAHDMLLYGDRGTGKSSTVRLMLREFADQGLRIISTSNNTDVLKKMFPAVRNQRWKYIFFIDDISFDSWGNNSALEFRSLIQGDLTDRPSNVVFYVTSNRRTIIRMDTADTDSADPRLSAEDKQEILALSDRFGLKVWFQTPTQEQYLAIVHGLARQHRLGIPENELERQALQWERWHNVRSPRTAQQFVRSLMKTPSGC